MPKIQPKESGLPKAFASFTLNNPKATSADQDIQDTPCGMSQAASYGDSDVARELAKMSELIKNISETQDKKLDEIKCSANAVESRLSEFAERLTHVEGHLAFLEDANQELQANPSATKDELDQLALKLVI